MRGIMLTILMLTIGRVAVNMTRRFPYPFVPSIARQLSVSVPVVQSIIALQASAGLASPIFGPLSERYRRKYVMISVLWVMAAAAFFAALVPGLWVFAVVMLIFGLGKVIYDPAMYAYMGDSVPYRRRGMALGFGELSWAASLLIAAPVAGLLLSRSDVGNITAIMLNHAGGATYIDLLTHSAGLQAVFLFLGVSCLIGGLLILAFVRGYPPNPAFASAGLSPRIVWRVMRSNPAALAGVLYALFVSSSNEVLFINYGLFMEERFGLSLALLGSLTVIISVAEVLGEFFVIGVADRIGLRRTTLAGIAVATLTYLIIPFSPTLTVALGLLFVLFLGVEIAIVSSIPLFTEVLPENRAIMMSSVAGAAGVGRVLGALIGGIIIALTGSFTVAGFTATFISAMAFIVLWRYVDLD